MKLDTEQARLEEIAGYFRTEEGFNGTLIRYGFRSLQPWLRGSCLELGSADGVMTEHLLGAVDELVSVDGSQHYIDELRLRFAGVRFDCSLFETYEPGMQFDCIVATHILEHVDDPTAIAARARQWIKPGGLFLVIVPNAHSFNRLMGTRMGMLADCHDLHAGDIAIGHRRVFDHDSMYATLTAAGWDVEHMGGVMFKPVANSQMGQWFDDQMIDACWKLGNEFPRNAADILAVCRG